MLKKLLGLSVGMLVSLTAALVSCGDSNDDPRPEPGDSDDYHFDIWVALDKHGGMARDVQTLVRSVASLEAGQPTLTFEGVGTEVNSVMTLETILKGAYYYQVPVSGDRFSKYLLRDNRIEVVAERRFEINTYSARKYTHAWIDDNTLLIMAATGDAKSVVWTRLNTDNMTVAGEGTLDLALPKGADMFTTSGLLVYRPNDRTLFYFYYGKTDGRRGTRVTPMQVAVIDPSTMAVRSNKSCHIDCEPVGSAYGELLQTTTLLADDGTVYVACCNDDADGNEESHLLRILPGQYEFDTAYDGFTTAGKLISLLPLTQGKAIAYARHDQLGTNIDDFSHYYTVLDLDKCTGTPVEFDGKPLPYSSGRFSSRMAVVGGKAYIGVDAQGVNPIIYIYDASTGKTAKGREMAPGYYFEQIRVVDNL